MMKWFKKKLGVTALEARLKLREAAEREMQPPNTVRTRLLGVLRGHGNEHPVVRGLLAMVEHQAARAEFDLQMPSSTSDQRHFNAGRAAALRDFQNLAEKMVWEANQPEKP